MHNLHLPLSASPGRLSLKLVVQTSILLAGPVQGSQEASTLVLTMKAGKIVGCLAIIVL